MRPFWSTTLIITSFLSLFCLSAHAERHSRFTYVPIEQDSTVRSTDDMYFTRTNYSFDTDDEVTYLELYHYNKSKRDYSRVLQMTQPSDPGFDTFHVCTVGTDGSVVLTHYNGDYSDKFIQLYNKQGQLLASTLMGSTREICPKTFVSGETLYVLLPGEDPDLIFPTPTTDTYQQIDVVRKVQGTTATDVFTLPAKLWDKGTNSYFTPRSSDDRSALAFSVLHDGNLIVAETGPQYSPGSAQPFMTVTFQRSGQPEVLTTTLLNTKQITELQSSFGTSVTVRSPAVQYANTIDGEIIERNSTNVDISLSLNRFANLGRMTKSDLVRGRKILCQIPANEKVRVPGMPRTGVMDILELGQRLPGNRILAKVQLSDIDWSTGLHIYWVLIDTSHPDENYCVQSSLVVAQNTPHSSLCTLDLSKDSTPMYTQYAVDYNSDGQYLCPYTLTQRNPTGLSAPFTDLLVQWKEGEYTGATYIARYRAATDKKMTFNLPLGVGCGKIIKTNSSNPKIRTQFYAFGDLYCSHV